MHFFSHNFIFELNYNIYSATNSQQRTRINDSDLNHKLDVKLPVYFIVHGWTESAQREWVQTVMKNILLYRQVNVCGVDWERLAKGTLPKAIGNAQIVGIYLSQFVSYLQQQGIPFTSINMIGHSLGAQVSAVCGQRLNGRLNSIYGCNLSVT